MFFFGVNGWKALIKKKLSACCRSWQPAQDRAKTAASVPVTVAVGVAVGVAVSWLMTNLRRQWKWLIFVFSFICVLYFVFLYFVFFSFGCTENFAFCCCCRCCRGVWHSVNTISNIVSIHKVGLLFPLTVYVCLIGLWAPALALPHVASIVDLKTGSRMVRLYHTIDKSLFIDVCAMCFFRLGGTAENNYRFWYVSASSSTTLLFSLVASV